jgi:hypothetical protein
MPFSFSSTRLFKWVMLAHIIMVLNACTSAGLYTPLPQQLENKAKVVGFSNVRAWGDAESITMQKSAEQSLAQSLKTYNGQLHTLNALALSGGGADGAFGAGLLCGWTKTGKRPTFQLVSGISTGAIIAPFAFLGPKYDKQLRDIYTTLSDEQIYRFNTPLSVIFTYVKPVLSPSIVSNKPMKHILKEVITQSMLDEIAREHLKGRRLLIGTSQLNAQRLVIWDIGAIANSHNPKALALVHKIILASSALPGIFPPQYFDLQYQGKKYKELHVDGGVETQVMLFEKAISPFAKVYSKHVEKNLYIIRNLKVAPEWQNVKPRLHYILGRVIVTLTKNQGIGDLYRLYAYCIRDHINYHLAYIPESFDAKSDTFFDSVYMQKLFKLGYDLGKSGYKWKAFPPGFGTIQ